MPIPAFKQTAKNTPGAEIKPAYKKLPDLPINENPLAVRTTTYDQRQGIRIGVERVAPGRPATSGIAPRTRLNPGSENPVFKDKTYVKDKKAFARKTAAEAAAASTPTKGKKGGKGSASQKSKKEDLSEHHYESVS